MDGRRALDDGVRDAVVVDQVLQRLPDLGLGQILVLLIEPEIVDGALGHLLDHDVGLAAQRLDLVGLEVAGDVDVALLEQQDLGRGLGDVAGDHALEAGRAAPVVGEALDDQRLVGLP